MTWVKAAVGIAGVVALTAAVAGFRGAGGVGGRGRTATAPREPGKILSWRAPGQFSDGAALDATRDLSCYEIYVNETGTFLPGAPVGATCPARDPVTGRPVDSIDLSRITPPLEAGKTYYLTMRSIDKKGVRSGFSLPPLKFTY